MNDRSQRLCSLAEMAEMVFDARTQRLARENRARDALKRQLADLEPGPIDVDLPWPAPELAHYCFEQWASNRRAEINTRLAAQTAVCLQVAEEARLALGRKLAVERLIRARLGR